MPRFGTCLVVLLVLFIPSVAQPGILNLRGGPGTVVLKDRDSRDSTRYGTLLLAATYRTPFLEYALDLPLRWEFQSGDFDGDIWNREGDWLRPLKLLRYSSRTGQLRGGLEVINNWTPGSGYLVRELSGQGEIDYVLPGLKIGWSEGKFDLEAGMDRAIDPAVIAFGIKWRAVRGVTLILEGASDPEAPLTFSGSSSGGRPVADDTERLTARAAGVNLELTEGHILDLAVGAHAGDINGDARGRGGELSATVDFSRSYLNRLHLQFRAIRCENGYVPAWFDATYPVYRWGPISDTNNPYYPGKPYLIVNPLDGTQPDRKMRSYEIHYDLGGFFSIGAGLDEFTDESMTRGRINAQLSEGNGRGLEIALWSRSDNPDVRLFSEDSNLHSRVSALYNILPHLLVNISFQHAWSFREEELKFLPLNSIMLGVLYDISL